MPVDPLKVFVANLMQYGLEYFGLYYGPYQAKVIDNKDPEARGRIRVSCPRAMLSSLNDEWVLPMMAGVGTGTRAGAFWPPEIGDWVWVFFNNGNPLTPASYAGGWYGVDELHADIAPTADVSPTKKGLVTPSGHSVIVNDDSEDGSITVRHRDGMVVRLTNDGKVQVGNGDGSFEPMLRGSTVKQWLESHTHSHAWGPTGPPIQPFPANGLSGDSETS